MTDDTRELLGRLAQTLADYFDAHPSIANPFAVLCDIAAACRPAPVEPMPKRAALNLEPCHGPDCEACDGKGGPFCGEYDLDGKRLAPPAAIALLKEKEQ